MKLTKMVGIRMTEKMYGELGEMAEGMGLRVADLGRWALARLLAETGVLDYRGYELWKAWYEQWEGNPYYPDPYLRCFFCGGSEEWEEVHRDGCVYVKACEMLGVEPQ